MRRNPVRLLRAVAVPAYLHLKMLATSAFDGFLQVIWPLFFATAAFLVFRVQGGHLLIEAALGASVMGVWSVVATTSSSALQQERWQGTLELLAAAPLPLAASLLSITLATATVGLYSFGATLLWGWLVFGIPLSIANPLMLAASVLATVLAIGMLGFLLSVTVVRYRTAWALGNLLEYPGWLLCGFLVPVASLPPGLEVWSYVLAPTWGVKAIKAAAAGGTPWGPLLACLGFGALYCVVGLLLTETILRSARRTASLSLS